MSFDWRTYFDLANDLIKLKTETAYRAAISRAYYSVYNILRVRANYVNRNGTSSHKDFINSLKNPGDDLYDAFLFEDRDDLVYIGNQLDDLRKARNEADYNGIVTVLRTDCTRAIDKVECIFDMLDEADED